MPWKNNGTGGSYQFYGNVNSFINYKNQGNFNLGTGDFTIEWWQYETDENGAPRPWAFGPWPDTQLGISFENSIIVWRWGSTATFDYVNPVKNTSNHFALVKHQNYMYLYQNGALCGQVDDDYGYDLGYNLTLGYEGGQYDSQCFAGNITNFNIVNYAKYTEGFTPTNTALTFDWNSNVFLAPFDTQERGPNTVGPYSPSNGLIFVGGNENWTNRSPFKYPHPEFPEPPTRHE